MTTSHAKVEETLGGAVVHNLPFPRELDEAALAGLKHNSPLQVEQRYSITYLHSYGQDSPWFAALTNGVLLGSRDPATGYTYANPRGHGMASGQVTDWVVLPNEGMVHAFTVCHFGSEEFLQECPYVLALIAFAGVDTLFLARLAGVDPAAASLAWIGMKVQARYLRNAKLKPTDVYFVPA
jgi:uncharacterized OB-fold protein